MNQMQNFMGNYKKSPLPSMKQLGETNPGFWTALQKTLNDYNEKNPGKKNIGMESYLMPNLASKGRRGDTRLAHVTPEEERLLKRRGGSGTINPKTGLREYFNWDDGGDGGDFDGGDFGGSGGTGGNDDDLSSEDYTAGELDEAGFDPGDFTEGQGSDTFGGHASFNDMIGALTANADPFAVGDGNRATGPGFSFATDNDPYNYAIDGADDMGMNTTGLANTMKALGIAPDIVSNFLGGDPRTDSKAGAKAIGSTFVGLPGFGQFLGFMDEQGKKYGDKGPNGDVVSAAQTGGQTVGGQAIGTGIEGGVSVSDIADTADYQFGDSGSFGDYSLQDTPEFVDPGPSPLRYPGDQEIPDFLDLSGDELQQRTQLATNALYRGGSYRDPRALDYYKYLAQRTLQNPNDEFVGRPLPIDVQLLTDVFGKTRQDSSEQFLRTLLA